MFTYPHADSIFVNFFNIINQLLAVEAIEDISTVKNQIDKFLADYQTTLDDIATTLYADPADQPSRFQVELITVEFKLISTLCYVYECHMKKICGSNYVIDEEIHQSALEIIALTKSKQLPESAFGRSFYYYLAFIISAYECTQLDADSSKYYNELIYSTLSMLENTYPQDYALAPDEEVITIMTPGQLAEFHEGYKIVITDQRKANNQIESCMLALTKRHVNLLMSLRKDKVSLLKESKLRELEDQLLQIDSLLKLFNLSDYQEFRKLYRYQLRHNRLHDNYIRNEIYLFENRLTVVSGLINPDNMMEDIVLASVLMDRYLALSENIFDVYDYLNDAGYETDRMIEIFLYHIKLLEFDIRLLAILASYCSKSHKSAIDIFNSLTTLLLITQALIYKFDPVDSERYKNAITEASLQDFKDTDLHSRAWVALYGLYYHIKFANNLQTSHSDQSRLKEFTNVALVFRSFVKNKLSDKDNDSNNHVNHYCIEYYLTVVYLCKNHDELAILMQNTLMRDVFALPIHANNENTYKFIFMLLSFHKSPDHIHLPIDEILINKMDFILVEQLFHTCKNSILNLLQNPYRIGGELGSFFLSNANAVLTRIMNDPLSKIEDLLAAKDALAALNKFTKTVYIRAMKLMERTSHNKLTYKPVSLVEAKNKEVVSQSFLRDLIVPDSTRHAIKTSRKSRKLANDANHGEYYPHVSHPIEKLKEHFQHDYQALYQFYHRKLGNRKVEIACHALLGCANTLYLLDNEQTAKQHAKQLNNVSHVTLTNALKSLSEETANRYQTEFTRLMKPWLDKPHHVVRVATQTVAVESVEAKRKTKLPAHRLFAPAPEKQRYPMYRKPRSLSTLLSPKHNLDEFHGMRVYRELPVIMTTQQKAIINLLMQEQLRPLVHGGTVIDLLFGIPPRDLDLLCFADKESLIAILNEHKEKYDIVKVRANINAPVIVIEFSPNNKELVSQRPTDHQLEILVLPGDKNKSYQMTQLALGYGVTFFIYDLTGRNTIDPFNLYDDLVQNHIFQVSDDNIDEYLLKNPTRMLDCLYRIAKFKHHNTNIKLCDALYSAIIKHIGIIGKLSIKMFDKLFMQGFATEFVKTLEPYADISLLFPNLHPKFLSAFEKVCVHHDAMLNKVLANIDQQKFEYLRALFFTNALYDSFIEERDLSHYLNNDRLFYIDCAAFLGETLFETGYNSSCGVLVNTIQDIWLKKIKSALDILEHREESSQRVAF